MFTNKADWLAEVDALEDEARGIAERTLELHMRMVAAGIVTNAVLEAATYIGITAGVLSTLVDAGIEEAVNRTDKTLTEMDGL